MNTIKWIPVVGYEDRYEITFEGNIRTKKYEILDDNKHVIKVLESKPVDVQKDINSNKLYVILHNGEMYKKEYVENLIQNTFLNGKDTIDVQSLLTEDQKQEIKYEPKSS